MIKVVIFDLDDTLISEIEYVKSGYKVVAKKIKKDYDLNDGHYDIFQDMFKIFHDDTKKVFNRLLNNYKLNYTDIYINQLVKTYRDHIPNIKFYDDVIPFLNVLKEKNIKTGIITDGYAITQKKKLEALQADKWFDKIIITDELGREYWKPSPKPFKMMKDYLKVQYCEMMYVADNPEKDFYIKKYYPIETVRICRDNAVHSKKIYYKGLKEDIRVTNLETLIRNGE